MQVCKSNLSDQRLVANHKSIISVIHLEEK